MEIFELKIVVNKVTTSDTVVREKTKNNCQVGDNLIQILFPKYNFILSIPVNK